MQAAFLVLLLAPGAMHQGTKEAWGLDLHVGSFSPAIGSAEERQYFQTYFGGSSPLLKGLQLNAFREVKFGTAAVYFSLAHWKVSGKTRVCRQGDEEVACTKELFSSSLPGSDSTTFSALPLSLGAMYRLDLLKKYLSIPLHPYARAGLDYVLWWSIGGNRISKTKSGAEAKGATGGAQLALGLSLNLDWASNTGRRSGTSSAIFVEAARRWDDHLGKKNRIDFSTKQVTAGVSLSFP